MGERILVIEDEFSINNILVMALKREGFEVYSASTGREGLKLFYEINPKVVLLDLMLPDISGEEVCEKISGLTYLIMVTAKSHITHKLKGLELGADHYITKPFDIREIRSKVRAILRTSDKQVIDCDRLKIYKEKKQVVLNGVNLDLNRKEYELLELLYSNKGLVFSRDKLLDRIWGFDFMGDSRTVDVHIRRLRAKLGDRKEDSIIKTVFGVGYVIR